MTTTRNEVTAMFNRFAGQSATLVIPRPYIDLCEGDHLAALLLSQILYWSDRTSDPNGWFAKSYADWHDELALTDRQIKRIVSGDDRRKQKGFSLDTVGVKTKLARSEYYQGAATLHYRVDYDVLSAKINEFSQVPTIARNDQCGKPPNGQNDDPTNGQNDHIHRLDHKEKTTGAKSAPDAGHFPEGTIGFDEMLESLDLTQADIDATPLDELIDDPVDESPTKPPVQPHIAIIDAWYNGMMGTPIQRSYPRNVKVAKKILEAGYTTKQVEDFTRLKSGEDFWRDKQVPLETVAKDMPQWVAAREVFDKPPAPPAEPVTFIHDPTCTACNYGMVIDDKGKSIQCPQCAASKEIA